MPDLEKARILLLDADALVSTKAAALDAYLDAAAEDGRSSERMAYAKAFRALMASVPRDKLERFNAVLKQIVALRAEQKRQVAEHLHVLKPGTSILVRVGERERKAVFLKMHRTPFEGEFASGFRFRAPVAVFVGALEDRP